MSGAQIKLVVFIVAASLLTACSTTRSVPDGDRLYTGAKVDVDGPSSVKAKQRKVLRSDLQGLTRPRPNSRFLGIPFKLMIYNMFPKAKPDSFFGRMRSRAGEPPVLLSEVN